MPSASSSTNGGGGGGGGGDSSNQKKQKKKGVRFEETVGKIASSAQGDSNTSHYKRSNPSKNPNTYSLEGGTQTRKKRPRPEYNPDELDDVDDWRPEDDFDYNDDDDHDGDNVVSERALLNAKRTRRLKREHEDDYNDDDDDSEGGGGGEEIVFDASASLLAEGGEDEGDGGGVAITPFNMEEEETDGAGYFEGDTYVFRHGSTKEQEEPDAWVDSLGEQDTTTTFPRKKKDQQTAAEEEEGRSNFDDWTEQELYAKILPFVSDTETITQAIVRYGSLIQHTNKKKKFKKAGTTTPPIETNNNNNSNEVKDSSQRAQDALNEITEASNALLLKGQIDIYQKTRNDLLLLLPHASTEEAGVRTTTMSTTAAVATEKSDVNQQPPSTTGTGVVVQWEYQGSQDGQIHGPFTTQQMTQWISAGYFVGPSAVKVRTVSVPKDESASDDNSSSNNKASSPSLQEDLMKDLMDGDDDDKEDEEEECHEHEQPNNKDPVIEPVVRGEWQMSDQVDFQQYS